MRNDDLILRQQRLLRRNAQLRVILANQAQVLTTPLVVADRASAGLQWLSRNPQWPLAALLLLVVLRPRRAMVWAGRAWWGWRTFKRVRTWVYTLPPSGIPFEA
jgi:hypothetical protein